MTRDRHAPKGYAADATNGYAKGLLNPFKSKRALLRLRDELEAEVHILTQAGRDMEQQYNARLLDMADILLRPHRDQKKLVPHIRWRDRAMRRMGDHLFESAMQREDLSEPQRHDLHDIEVERCLYNARAGLINSELRRLRKVLPALERADDLLKHGRSET